MPLSPAFEGPSHPEQVIKSMFTDGCSNGKYSCLANFWEGLGSVDGYDSSLAVGLVKVWADAHKRPFGQSMR